jgi:hypothetical protein
MPTSLLSTGVQFPDNSVQGIASNYIVRTYTAPATWTKPTGLKAVKVTVVGGGGGGGGAAGVLSQTNGGVGACGGTAIKLAIDAPSIPGPVAVTVGAGGAGGVAATPGNFNITAGTGGTSSFGPFVSATGGQGAFSSPGGPAAVRTPGSGSGGDFNYGSPQLDSGAFNTNKIATPTLEAGIPGPRTGYASWLYPEGYGRARVGGTALGEAAATNSGGSAGGAQSAGPSIAGQAGAAGIVIVEEFY